MVVPDMSNADILLRGIYGDQSIDGDWYPGSIHKGINYTSDDNNFYLSFTTAESINLNSLNTYFIITVYDAYKTEIAEVRTQVITENNNNVVAAGTNLYIGVAIDDFIDYKNGYYSAKPTFDINIGKLLPTGGRFSIKIEHVNDNLHFVYNTGDIILNKGKLPTVPKVDGFSIKITANATGNSIDYISRSGLRYIKSRKNNI